MTLTANSAALEFERNFGYAPTGVWSAPGRANLIGEHTDYNQGLVLPFAIDKRTFVAVAPRHDGVIRVTSEGFAESSEYRVDALESLDVHGWSAYPLGVILVLVREHGLTFDGIDISIQSDVPTGAGLSSSAAIECATALALNDTYGLGLTASQLAVVGQRAENTVVGAPTGFMDQFASMWGEEDSAVFLDCATQELSLVQLGLGDYVVLAMDTQETHSHATGGYASRRASCDAAVGILGLNSLRDLTVEDLPVAAQHLDEETYRRVRHVVTENERVLNSVAAFRSGELAQLGPLFAASHASMRDDFEISTPALDLAVETSLSAGAIAARMTGGGFGGAALALVARGEVNTVVSSVEQAFTSAGMKPPHQFLISPSAGARKESL